MGAHPLSQWVVLIVDRAFWPRPTMLIVLWGLERFSFDTDIHCDKTPCDNCRLDSGHVNEVVSQWLPVSNEKCVLDPAILPVVVGSFLPPTSTNLGLHYMRSQRQSGALTCVNPLYVIGLIHWIDPETFTWQSRGQFEIRIQMRWSRVFDALKTKLDTHWRNGLNQSGNRVCFLGTVWELPPFLARVKNFCQLASDFESLVHPSCKMDLRYYS